MKCCVFNCVDALYKCYVELDVWDDAASPRNLGMHGKQFLLLYVELGTMCGADQSVKSCPWRLYPKHHLFAHLCADAVGNPKLTWNYTMESAMGDAAAVAARCHRLHIHRVLLRRVQLSVC